MTMSRFRITSSRTPGVSRFYIASSRDRIDDVRAIAAVLRRHGLEDAFPWPEHFTHTCSLELCGVTGRAHLAHLELAGASLCDLFIGIARLGKGAHVELGAALALGRTLGRTRIILVGTDRADSVFYEASKVEHVKDLDALLVLLGLRP